MICSLFLSSFVTDVAAAILGRKCKINLRQYSPIAAAAFCTQPTNQPTNQPTTLQTGNWKQCAQGQQQQCRERERGKEMQSKSQKYPKT